MANVATLDLIHRHLFRKEGASLTPSQKAQLERYEYAFSMWLDKPYIRDTALRKFLEDKFEISRSQAYEDIRNLQVIFGNVKNASKEWYRYLANDLVKSAIEDIESEEAGKLEVAKADQKIRAALALDKINRLNKLDVDPIDWTKIIPQNYNPTNDPQHIKGWKKKWSRQELHDRQDKLYNKYDEEIEITEIEYEELPDRE